MIAELGGTTALASADVTTTRRRTKDLIDELEQG
jgi:hypothetical protein